MAGRGTWRTVIATLAISAGAVLLGIVLFVYGGVYNMAASEPHWPVTTWILETARQRAIQAHARDIVPPLDLDDPAKLPMGVEHFAAHCAVCHGAPGVPKGDIAEGLYPAPPDLAVTAKDYTAGELFWIIKHGLKMTGMPGWGGHADAEIWSTVAFLRKLGAGMTEQQYGEMVKTNMMRGMRHEPGTAAPPPHQH